MRSNMFCPCGLWWRRPFSCVAFPQRSADYAVVSAPWITAAALTTLLTSTMSTGPKSAPKTGRLKCMKNTKIKNSVRVFGLALLMGMSLSSLVKAAPAADTQASMQAPVNLNQASAEELTKLKGIGPKMAERILAYRKEHGPFKTVDQIVEVKGIGNAKFQKLKDKITV